MPRLLLAALAALLASPAALAQFGLAGNTSGAPLHPEAAAYDVQHVGLSLTVDPEARMLKGTMRLRARIVAPTAYLRLDLDDRLPVSDVVRPSCTWQGTGLVCADTVYAPNAFERLPGQIRVALGRTMQPGELVSLRVDYGGAPREAPNPPWDGGLTWATTESGQPWIATSVQGEGADLWWPAKDHPSDEPDQGAIIELTGPADLRMIANGRHAGRHENGDGMATETWQITTPINNYGVAIGIGPYVEVTETYRSPLGYEMPATFYVLLERESDARRQMPGFLDALGFMERTFGPYGSRQDGYHVIHTPHLGMEHQSLIAYGSTFRDNAFGFDWLHFHELAHEWWANLGTAPDWRDFWVHESFANYAEALYAEDLVRRETGNEAMARDAYLRYLAKSRPNLQNVVPVAPSETRTTTQMYNLPEGGFNGDIYYKGAWFLHTLRFVIGDDPAFFRALRAILYPDGVDLERDPSRDYRWVSTEDVLAMFQRETQVDLAPYIAVYLRQPALPVLHVEYLGNEGYALRWEVPEGVLPEGTAFELPVRTSNGLIPMPGGEGGIGLPRNRFQIDERIALFEVVEAPAE
ncbi:MAG: M1 family metallopeptidase [Bacteroidota bacterium]